MVSVLTKAERDMIDAAVEAAENKSAAEIRVVVVRASARYRKFILMVGLVIGSMISFGLWLRGVLVAYPWLLAVQLGTIIIVDLLIPLCPSCCRLLPKKIIRQRAQQLAYGRFYAIHAHLPPQKPFTLLFVSLAEHSVHIITNGVIHQRIPDKWDAVTNHFVATLREKGVGEACVKAVGRIGEILSVFKG